MPEKSLSGIGISSGSQLPQSDIGIPASEFSPDGGQRLVRHCRAMIIECLVCNVTKY
jgi:hypothetical protein